MNPQPHIADPAKPGHKRSDRSTKLPGHRSGRSRPRELADRLSRRAEALHFSNGAIAGAVSVAALGVGLGLFYQWYRGRDERSSHSPAAFAGHESHAENFDQTRSAGPDAMRDDDGTDWDAVDQASDESFPASDPPANY